ncbi:hypothetical protein CH365_02300 [Leptospira neocaledonica]|uniref:Uncharacterized protein n=1 Tax=Leptospira neocaledonica TaxID=2023192 RepID=A0A2N0A4L4_9LEPT|nr:hypothetical protein CH365_02300 [Leptospira neocaledonica]
MQLSRQILDYLENGPNRGFWNLFSKRYGSYTLRSQAVCVKYLQCSSFDKMTLDNIHCPNRKKSQEYLLESRFKVIRNELPFFFRSGIYPAYKEMVSLGY